MVGQKICHIKTHISYYYPAIILLVMLANLLSQATSQNAWRHLDRACYWWELKIMCDWRIGVELFHCHAAAGWTHIIHSEFIGNQVPHEPS